MPRSKASMERTAERYKQKRAAVAVDLAGYDPITELACKQAKATYFNHGDNQYSVEQRTQLGKATLPSGVSILTDGRGQRLQTRANGRPLAELPYTT